MNDKLKFNFPEVRLYLAFIFVLCITISYFDREIGIFVFIVLIYLVFYNARAIRYKNTDLLVDLKNLSIDMDEAAKQTMLDFPVPFCIINSYGKIKWNNLKMSQILDRDDMIGKSIQEIAPNLFDIEKLIPKEDKQNTILDKIKIKDRIYKIEVINLTKNNLKGKKYVMYFFDETENLELIDKYNNMKPVVSIIQIDNFDEVINSTADDFRPLLEADIQRKIRLWVEKKDGIMTMISKDKFFVIFNEAMLRQAEEEKFNILDDVREIEFSNTIPVTLSIGVSTYENSLSETHKSASTSLEMALGRGGDQAVCKIYDKTVFYGGKSKAVEKRTRVRARIVAHAIRDLVTASTNVLVMGHKYPDLDAMGSCMGIVAISKMLSKPVKIVLEKSNNSVDELYKKIISIDEYKNIFVPHEEANKLMGEKTLLVVVDTHRPSLTEMPSLIEQANKIVLIDHHRRGLEFLDKAVVTYHETYASSASEMVTEIIQYIKDYARIDIITAEALLAGITLDTKNFVFKTGVRTFEAAAFLKKNLADTIQVKKFFQGDYESFILRANCIQNARILDENIAISSYDKKVENPSLLASQIADELLNIRGVKASFVLIEGTNNQIQISARSLENINVQLIMEKLGGGGHIDTAATQLKDTDIQSATKQLEQAIKDYFKEEE